MYTFDGLSALKLGSLQIYLEDHREREIKYYRLHDVFKAVQLINIACISFVQYLKGYITAEFRH